MVNHSEINFGRIAVRKGFITPRQLGKAVTLQLRVDLSKGIRRHLREVLVEIGFMTQSQVEEVQQVII